ncbi:Di-glucose binding protein with Leucine-rich repeat domain-containing protein [Perilla frutescens var. hirtella]|nr:Di-glucose binding protein with Leucine-rich repeat domain-containing protein [Perilla frutescens var. hirtella]KAH6805406.1 Di-glucose binding protein with Leucine-rich repeat domain-containing protein [Perilla frutescens var. frutescens]
MYGYLVRKYNVRLYVNVVGLDRSCPFLLRWKQTAAAATNQLTMSIIHLLLLLFSLIPFSHSLSNPFNYSIHIDCGSHDNSTDAFHTTWLSDRFYSGGATSVVSEPLHFRHLQEKTLRYFPISSGKKNCYSIPTPAAAARYLLRAFNVYDNFDGKSHSPSFDVSVEGTLVFSWRSPWSESVSRSGAYSDLFFYHDDSAADVCFYSIATDSPLVSSLELTLIDDNAYPFDYEKKSSSYILINYGRFSSGSDQWGPGFSNDTDVFGRTWASDADFRLKSVSITNGATIKAISAIKNVGGAETSPNYFPEKLYETAITAFGVGGSGGGVLEYELPVDAKLDYLMWFHFAEIDVSVRRAGQRVFDVMVNEENVKRVDVFKEVGSFTAYHFSFVVKNLSSTTLTVRLEPVAGAPLICGLENYAIVPVDLRTMPDQVVGMRALKESLHVPDRMGWNGDPCAPTVWDAWEGVTCHPTNDESHLLVTQIDLGSQGLKGYISDQIGLLTSLVSLNLSSNSLGGNLPSGLGQKSLVKLDLSNNKFTGFIPDSLTSSSLQLVLFNDNLLEGEVPEELYSIGVHGGKIDLSGNKGLCGLPPLPKCPLLWGKNGLSTGGKLAIALSCLIIVSSLALGIYYCMRRQRSDYDFALPHELASLSAKRNRYQRQKSLMTLEMESQHAKGFIPTYGAN